MPIVIQCPSCERRLRVRDELLGKKVKCPGCQETFTAVSDEEPLPTERDEEVPVKEATARRRRAAPEEGIEERPSVARSRGARPPVEDEGEDDQGPSETEEEEEERPRRRKRRKRRRWEEAAAAVAVPAICLMVAGIIATVLAIVDLVLTASGANLLAAVGIETGQGGNDAVPPGYRAGLIIGVTFRLEAVPNEGACTVSSGL